LGDTGESADPQNSPFGRNADRAGLTAKVQCYNIAFPAPHPLTGPMATVPVTTESPSASAFTWSALMRAAAVSAIVAALWLAVAWAIG
jgi:hypothetical protein